MNKAEALKKAIEKKKQKNMDSFEAEVESLVWEIERKSQELRDLKTLNRDPCTSLFLTQTSDLKPNAFYLTLNPEPCVPRRSHAFSVTKAGTLNPYLREKRGYHDLSRENPSSFVGSNDSDCLCTGSVLFGI